MEKEFNKRLREFGFSFSIGMALLLIIGYFREFNKIFLIIVTCLLFYHLIFAIIFPKVLIPTYYLISFITKIIGNTLNFIVFTIIFYIFFTPISLILKLFKKDQIKKISKIPQWYDVSDKENDPKRVEKLY